MIKLKSLSEPLDFYGKTWIVKTISKEDLNEYIGEKKASKLDDDQMSAIADKLGESIMDCYWDALDIIAEDYK